MIFLTVETIRQRAIEQGGELALSATERLTPAAMDYIRAKNIRVVDASSAGSSAVSAPPAQEKAAESCVQKPAASCAKAEPVGKGLTHLDAASMVAKTHPRIEARGRLDSLMAAAVLVQTQFDPKGKLPAMLKDCLAEVKEWIFQSLAAEISGSILPPQGMGGMDMDVLRTVSRNPRQYLHTDHLTPDDALGANIALLNWLRTQVREAELAAARAALCRTDIQESLNRLSGAVYVLMLLTHLAESGAGIPKLQ
jgi:ethanolamine utilization cobalamin adenosyltransferase